MTEQRKPNYFNKKATLVLLVVSLASLVTVSYSIPFFYGNGGGGDPVYTDRVTVGNITIHVNFKDIPDVDKLNASSKIADATVFDITNAEFDVEYQQYGNGKIIERIDGQGNGWLYYVDGTYINYACNLYVLENGSVIDWIQV